MVATDLSDLEQVLRFTGHYFKFEDPRRSHLWENLQRFRLFFMLACNPFTLSSLFIGGLKSSLGVEAFFGLMGFLTVIQHSYACLHCKEIEQIIKSIKRIRAEFQTGTDQEFIGNVKSVWKFVHFYFFMMTFLIVTYIIFPKIVDFLVSLVWDHPTAYLLPLSMNGFFEKEQPRNMKYLAITSVVIVWCSVSSYSHVGYDSLLGLVGMYYSSLTQTFCRQLRTELPGQGSTNQQTTAVIKRFAAQQRALHCLTIKMRSLFGFPYAVQNLFGSFCICSLLYAILSDTSSNTLVMAANLFNFMFLAGMLSSTAYMGQHITDQSTTIFEALYDLPWFELRPADRKYFISMISVARDPFTIHYHGRGPLDLKNLMVILNTSYSYFMFMKSTL